MCATTLDEYGTALFGGEDDFLRAIREEAIREGLPAIQVPPELGRLLSVLVAARGARSVLEIGTLFGYSTILLARALPLDGRVTSLEVNPKHADLARRNVQRAGLADRVEIELGPALESLQNLNGRTFDLVFIDADKPAYPDYLEWALRLTSPGDVIVADNVWRRGEVLLDDADEAASAMARFNRLVADNRRLRTTIVSTRDGGDAAIVSVVRAE